MSPDPKPDPRATDEADDDGILQNEYEGAPGRDGIPANGTEPVAPRGPDDLGA